MIARSPAVEQRSRQQTIFDAAVAQRIHEFPMGIVLRADLSEQKFRDFIVNNTQIQYLVLNFSDVWKVLQEGMELRDVIEPWHIPIIVATEEDELVRNRQREQIRQLLRAVQPAIYVPDAGTVYRRGEETLTEQRGGVEQYKIRLRWLSREVECQGWNIRILPLAKGMKQWHFEEYLSLFEEFDYTEFAFYAVQYTGGKAGNAINDLVAHVNNFITVTDPDNVFIIGRHGQSHLRKLPPRVTGASGLRAFKRNCTDESNRYSESDLTTWRPNAREALFSNHDIAQPKLDEY